MYFGVLGTMLLMIPDWNYNILVPSTASDNRLDFELQPPDQFFMDGGLKFDIFLINK